MNSASVRASDASEISEAPLWDDAAAPTPVPARPLARLRASSVSQARHSRVCPDDLRLDGRLALVTGGNAGIGLATCRGLLQRGARVLMLSRNAAKAAEACRSLDEDTGAGERISSVPMDLADPPSVLEAVRRLEARLGAQRVDVLVCNAGLWPLRHRVTAAGHELAFATNVLGHFLLLRSAIPRLLAPRARVVIVTGDIYVLARSCTPEYRFRTPWGGMLAYCRSKLGNHWLALELQRREPGLEVAVVHPGVVASELGGSGGALGRGLRKRLSIDVDRGAQASIYAASAPNLPPCAYLHNTLGRAQLAEDDPARDETGARRLWDECEAFYQELLRETSASRADP